MTEVEEIVNSKCGISHRTHNIFAAYADHIGQIKWFSHGIAFCVLFLKMKTGYHKLMIPFIRQQNNMKSS